MSDTCCPFIKPDGAPCAAHPLPNSDFCLFHDPAHQQALAASRSKGGSTPRRRLRRFPRLLDHVHVAELLGELFVEALNQTDVSDTKRLQTLTNLSRVLLQAVGTPPRPPVAPSPSAAAPAAPGIPPLAGEGLGKRSAEQDLNRSGTGLPGTELPSGLLPPRSAPDSTEPLPSRSAFPPLAPHRTIPTPPPSDPSDPSDPSPSVVPSRPLPVTASPEPPAGEGTHGRAPSAGGTPAVPTSPEDLDTRTPEHLNPEQEGNRSGTGLPGIHAPQPAEPGACHPIRSAEGPAPPGGASRPDLSSRPRAGWPAHSPLPTRAIT
jgi:hypothetical protein